MSAVNVKADTWFQRWRQVASNAASIRIFASALPTIWSAYLIDGSQRTPSSFRLFRTATADRYAVWFRVSVSFCGVDPHLYIRYAGTAPYEIRKLG